jgi:diacylglycerol kinase family enzyme
MSGRYALLLNVHSRKIRKDPAFLPALRKTFQERGPFLALKDPTELPAAMTDVRKFQPDLFFVCGGDGTLRQTLSELIRAYGNAPLPKIAILKSGTMNTVAAGFGIKAEARDFLRSLLMRCDRGLPLPSRLLRPLAINDTHGFIFAVGGFSSFIVRYAAVADPSPFRAFAMLTRTTMSALVGTPYARSLFTPFVARIWKDGQPSSEQVTAVSASAVRHIGFGFLPFAHAEGPGGQFGGLILKSSPAALVPHLWKIRRGEPIHGSTIEQFPVSSLRIEIDSALPAMVDGDILAPRKEFALGRGPALDFITG